MTTIGNQLAVKDTTIKELENELKDLKSDQKDLQTQLDGYEGTNEILASTEELINVTAFYLAEGDIYQVSDDLARIKESVVLDETSNAFRNLYNGLFAAITPQIVWSPPRGYGRGDW